MESRSQESHKLRHVNGEYWVDENRNYYSLDEGIFRAIRDEVTKGKERGAFVAGVSVGLIIGIVVFSIHQIFS